MIDKPTGDEFNAKAAELLPHYGALHGIIAGCICPCVLRPAVAAALRDSEARGRTNEMARIEAIADFYPEISGRALINAAKETLP